MLIGFTVEMLGRSEARWGYKDGTNEKDLVSIGFVRKMT
jgi:hypothetical protein